MMRRKTRTPVSSFGPELMEALIRGSLEPITLKFPRSLGGYSLAVRFQQRIHQLRARMLEESHEKSSMVARTRTSLRWGARAGLPPVANTTSLRGVEHPIDRHTEAHLLIQPHDHEFTSILATAGIGREVATTPTDPTETQSLAPDPILDAYLRPTHE